MPILVAAMYRSRNPGLIKEVSFFRYNSKFTVRSLSMIAHVWHRTIRVSHASCYYHALLLSHKDRGQPTPHNYNFQAASDFDNLNMTDGPGRSYKYLKDPGMATW